MRISGLITSSANPAGERGEEFLVTSAERLPSRWTIAFQVTAEAGDSEHRLFIRRLLSERYSLRYAPKELKLFRGESHGCRRGLLPCEGPKQEKPPGNWSEHRKRV